VLPFAPLPGWAAQKTARPVLKILMKSAWGSDDPTKAAFPFLHGLALAEAGHQVQIFLLGEAVNVMRKTVASAVVPVGWPPLLETLEKVAGRNIQIYACGACSRESDHRSGPHPVGSEIWQPHHLCLAGGMGGSDHHGMMEST
jgi:predicted peroxiredoxin